MRRFTSSIEPLDRVIGDGREFQKATLEKRSNSVENKEVPGRNANKYTIVGRPYDGAAVIKVQKSVGSFSDRRLAIVPKLRAPLGNKIRRAESCVFFLAFEPSSPAVGDY